MVFPFWAHDTNGQNMRRVDGLAALRALLPSMPFAIRPYQFFNYFYMELNGVQFNIFISSLGTVSISNAWGSNGEEPSREKISNRAHVGVESFLLSQTARLFFLAQRSLSPLLCPEYDSMSLTGCGVLKINSVIVDLLPTADLKLFQRKPWSSMLRYFAELKPKDFAMLWLIIAAIFGHILYLPSVSCEEKMAGTCPSLCTCSQKTVDCSRKKLKTFPTSLPSTTLIL